MNERVLQFRIGMFVIVAGLVLTMLIVWFESPAFFRGQRYVTVFFPEAPGVDRGIPVRKSGVRVGEVFAFEFTGKDESEDGVLVTLALDSKYYIREGTIPKLGRAIIGDVSIDLLPGDGERRMPTYSSPTEADKPSNRIRGLVATDPFVMLTDATKIFDQIDVTLKAIETAAVTLSGTAKKADSLDVFLETWRGAGEKLDVLAGDINRVIRDNEAEIKPTMTGLRNVVQRVDLLLDDQTQADVKRGLERIASASARLDTILADLEPTVADLKLGPGAQAKTNVGQVMSRLNRIAFDVSLLTGKLNNGQNQLNNEGAIQRLFVERDLYDNLNGLARSARSASEEARGVLRNLGVFAEKIARKPSLIGEGVLGPR